MYDLLRKIQPADIIAIVVIIGGLILVGSGIDTFVGSLLTSVVFYYFGKRGQIFNQ